MRLGQKGTGINSIVITIGSSQNYASIEEEYTFTIVDTVFTEGSDSHYPTS